MFHVEQPPPRRPSSAPAAAPGGAAPAARGVRRHGPGHAAVPLLLCAVFLAAPGCAGIRSVRLYFPETSGLEAVRPGVYVDPAMTASQRETFAAALEAGRRQAAEFYGGLVSSPDVFACASKACTRRFGGIGKGMTRTAGIFLSPEGLTPVIVAHEWSHAEFAARVGWVRRWWSVPQWFDEGLAVLVSRDPVYTEDAWRAATENGAKAPRLSELDTLRGWLRVTGEDGKTKQLSYGTARREVAAWYAAAGSDGLRRLIEGLRRGERFSQLYERTGKSPVPTGRSTWNIPASGGSRGPTAGPGAGGAARMTAAGGSGADGTTGGPAAGDAAGGATPATVDAGRRPPEGDRAPEHRGSR